MELIQYAIKYGKENYDVGLDSESDEDDPSGVRRNSYSATTRMFEDRFGLGPTKIGSDRKASSSASTSCRSSQAQGGRGEEEVSMNEVTAQLVTVVAPLTEFVQGLQRQRIAAAQRQPAAMAAGAPMIRPAVAGVVPPLRCYNCNQSGHLGKDCPKPRTQSGPAGPTGPSQIPLAVPTAARQGRVAMVMDTGTTEMVTPAATEIGPNEYMAVAMFEPGTIGVIRHVQRITEESDLGPWRPGFEDLTAPSPEYKDGHIDVLDALKALDLRIPYHVEHIEWVLHALKDAGFKVALEKSEFFLSEISLLGYIVTVDGLKPDPRKVAAVQEAPAPVTLTQVRAFLGLASYYRHFIKGFAGVAKLLTNLLKKEEQLIWTPECEAAFQALKEALTSAPLLARPDPTRPFALYTDWQPQAISAVLTQHGEDEREHVIEYASNTLSQAQANYEAALILCTSFLEYLVELTDVEPLAFADEDAWELHRALYKSVTLGMFRFFVDHEDHCIGEHFAVYYVITRPKPAQKEGTVALYPFAQLQTIDPRLLELIHLELLSIAQVIANEEEEIQPRLWTATALRRTYNEVVIPDYIAHRTERLEDFPEEKPLRPPSSYPRPAPPKAPRKTPKRKRHHPSPGAQGSRIGGGAEVIQPACTRNLDPAPGSAATLVKAIVVPSPPFPRVPDLNLDGAGPSAASAAGGGSRMGILDPISRPPVLAGPLRSHQPPWEVDFMVEPTTIRLEAIAGAPRPDPAWEPYLTPPFQGCIAARLAGTLIYETMQRPNVMYHFLVFAAQKRERWPYTETHVVMKGPGPRSVRKRVVRAVADQAPRVLSHVPRAFLYPSFVQHHFQEEDAPTTPAAMTAFLPPIPPPLNPDINHFL
ncbi:hypothetical protein CBR_g38754 [Chara braunii]|uniref:CCHC-type domain-containing protein n=1 Tax=Chara braunii TaxID=69332 RepID=A0A388LQ50_CHABU|nr:hypothetical protein CBR_g38754 [Chara braunii]|eukprot:GBG84470.1 hypothetical protein CBR_g38754 [Chara braunii]